MLFRYLNFFRNPPVLANTGARSRPAGSQRVAGGSTPRGQQTRSCVASRLLSGPRTPLLQEAQPSPPGLAEITRYVDEEEGEEVEVEE